MKQVYVLILLLSIFCLSPLVTVSAITYTKYEYYSTTEDSYSSIYEYRTVVQLFTVTTEHDLYYIRLELGKIGNPRTAVISIMETASGIPTTILGTTFFDTAKIITSPSIEWYEIMLITPIHLDASTQYAIQVNAPNGNYTSNNILCWATDSAGPYTGGYQVISPDGGQNWNTYTAYDCLFEEWGYVYQPPILEAFPQFYVAIIAGIVCGALGFGISQLGDVLGGHPLAGFIMGGAIGLVVCASSGLIPIWMLTVIFMCGSIGVYFWMKS